MSNCSGFKVQRSSIVLAIAGDKSVAASANESAKNIETLLVRFGKFFKPSFLLFDIIAFVAFFVVLHFF